jgi:hypothetical protein
VLYSPMLRLLYNDNEMIRVLFLGVLLIGGEPWRNRNPTQTHTYMEERRSRPFPSLSNLGSLSCPPAPSHLTRDSPGWPRADWEVTLSPLHHCTTAPLHHCTTHCTTHLSSSRFPHDILYILHPITSHVHLSECPDGMLDDHLSLSQTEKT